MAKKEDNYETEDIDGLIDALSDFPIDDIEIEEGDSDFTEEEIEQMAQGKTLAEIRGPQKPAEAPASVAKPVAKEEKASAKPAAKPVAKEENAGAKPVAKEENASAKPAAKPKKAAVVRVSKKKPAAEAKPAEDGAASGEKALPFIRVTTDGKGRAQLGENASSPVAKWRVEVIDPRTGEPLPFGDNGETFVDLEGHPLLNYARFEHDLKPKIRANVGEVQKEVRGIVDRTSEMEEKFETAEEEAAFSFDSVLNEMKGTDAYKYLTETKHVTEGEKGEIVTSVAPWVMVKLILQKVIGYTGGEGSNRDAAARALMETIGVPSYEQADRLIGAAYKMTDFLPGMADKLARKRESGAYWDDQFTQGLNLGGNFQSMYNYMLMDNNDRNRPMMTAFRNGQRVDIIDWDKFYDTEGPVGKRVRVHPSLDLPFLYADSEEAKALLDAAKGKDGKIDFKKLEDDLASKNAELFGEGRYLELTDDQDIFDDNKLARALRKRFGEGFAKGDKELLGEDAFKVLNSARDKESGKIDIPSVMDALKLDENKEARNKLATMLLKKRTLIPDWELIKKYGTLQQSLGENWAKFMRNIGGQGYFNGFIGGRSLHPGSLLSGAQYNPVLRNLYARALEEAPDIAKVLYTYYLNYGEDPFVPSAEQLLAFARQPEEMAGKSLDWIYANKGGGKLDRATGLSKNNLDTIANSLSQAIWFPKQRDYDELSKAFPGTYTSIGGGKFRKSDALENKIAPIRDAWKKESGRGDWSRSPEWQKLVLRAYFEELMEDPDIPRRLLDPSGFGKTYAVGNMKQLEGRQRAREAQLLEAILRGEDVSDDDWKAIWKYDIPIEEARAFLYRMAKRILDMELNGDKNLRYIDGKGLVRILPSDRRVKKPVRRGKKLGRRLAPLLANPLEGGQVSDKRAKEPIDWETWEARRKMLIGEDR